MDKEYVEELLNKIVTCSREFEEAPSYEQALELDKHISILRLVIGEANFLPLHYIRRAHEHAVRYIDEYDRAKK